MDEIARIISTLKKTFKKNAWHGPTVMEALTDVSDEESRKKLGNTHSIGELVLHMNAWGNFVVSRLVGDNNFQVTDQMNFPEVKRWSDAVSALADSQEKLLEAIRNFPAQRLQELVPHGEFEYTFYTLIHGIIHHDLYHTGQIMLIKKALR